jgi:hypothetical protein
MIETEAELLRAVERERRACWFTCCADEAEDLTDGQKAGFRLAAEHLRNDRCIAEASQVYLPLVDD